MIETPAEIAVTRFLREREVLQQKVQEEDLVPENVQNHDRSNRLRIFSNLLLVFSTPYSSLNRSQVIS